MYLLQKQLVDNESELLAAERSRVSRLQAHSDDLHRQLKTAQDQAYLAAMYGCVFQLALFMFHCILLACLHQYPLLATDAFGPSEDVQSRSALVDRSCRRGSLRAHKVAQSYPCGSVRKLPTQEQNYAQTAQCERRHLECLVHNLPGGSTVPRTPLRMRGAGAPPYTTAHAWRHRDFHGSRMLCDLDCAGYMMICVRCYRCYCPVCRPHGAVASIQIVNVNYLCGVYCICWYQVTMTHAMSPTHQQFENMFVLYPCHVIFMSCYVHAMSCSCVTHPFSSASVAPHTGTEASERPSEHQYLKSATQMGACRWILHCHQTTSSLLTP